MNTEEKESQEQGSVDSVGHVVRPDRNLEKWPLWEPSNSRHRAKERTLQREIRLPDGSIAFARVVVGYSNYGVLSTEDQKVCYALIKLWEERSKPKGAVHFSRQQLARVLKKSWGSKVNKSLTDSLFRLRFTPFVWERSYYDSIASETVERIDTFNILSELNLTRRTKGSITTTESSTFCLNERILTNLLNGHTRPVFLDTILSFKSEIAQILYTHLDLVMADKTNYERRTRELFLDLGIDGTAYRYQSKRAQALEGALRELQGAVVPHGILTEVKLEQTVDKKDFKLVVRKEKKRLGRAKKGEGSAAIPPRLQEELELFTPVVTAVVNEAPSKKKPKAVPKTEAKKPLVTANDASPEEASEQVRHFYQIFFQSGTNAQPTPKELTLAAQHLERLGQECARYMVLFAYREAKQTKFAIQNYGGLAQYEGRAAAEFRAHEAQRQEAHQKKTREAHQRLFMSAHGAYLEEYLERFKTNPNAQMADFFKQEQEEKLRLASGKLAETDIGKRALTMFTAQSARLERFRAFLKAQLEKGKRVEGVLTFWEWDAAHNPEKLKQ